MENHRSNWWKVILVDNNQRTTYCPVQLLWIIRFFSPSCAHDCFFFKAICLTFQMLDASILSAMAAAADQFALADVSSEKMPVKISMGTKCWMSSGASTNGEEKPTQMSARSHNRCRQTRTPGNLFCSLSGLKDKQMFCWFPGIRCYRRIGSLHLWLGCYDESVNLNCWSEFLHIFMLIPVSNHEKAIGICPINFCLISQDDAATER